MTIIIRLEDGKLVPFLPDGKSGTPAEVKPHDTIRWESPLGPVRVAFHNGSPFGPEGEFAGSVDHEVTEEKDAKFQYECGVTIDGEVVGWPEASAPGSGGEIIIVRRKAA